MGKPLLVTPEIQAEVDATARAVGHALSNWGKLESIICGLYAAALRVPVYEAASGAFYSIVSFQGKMKAADACFKREFRDSSILLAEWSAFKKVALGVNDKRNQLAHGAIQILNTQPPIVGWFPFWNGSQIAKALEWNGAGYDIKPNQLKWYSSDEVLDIREEFNAAYWQGQALYEKVCASLADSGKTWGQGG